MRKPLFSLTFICALLVLPAFAQDEPPTNSILEIANATEELSTLVAAVEAADPAVSEALSGDGPITVLAPTNQAFANLAATLDVAPAALLDGSALSTDLLTQILQYHLLEGSLFAEDIATFNGDFAPTLLPDHSVGVTVATDGGMILNEVVNVTTTNIEASNGVVHLIDDVILPQVALDALLGSFLRVMHFAPDAPPVDVFLNEDRAITNLAYGSATTYVSLPSGTYEAVIVPTGDPIDSAVIGPLAVELSVGAYENLVAIGSLESETISATQFEQAIPELEASEAALLTLHAIEGASAVNLRVNDELVINRLEYPFTSVDSNGNPNDGAFDITFTPAAVETLTIQIARTGDLVLDLSGANLSEGLYYTVIAGGTPQAPQAFLFLTDVPSDEANSEADETTESSSTNE